MEETRIENIVATVALGCTLDLDRLLLILPDSRYDPEYYQALVHRDKTNRGSLLVNASGKVVCAGFKSERALGQAVDDLVRFLQENGFDASRGHVQIQNIVVSTAIPLAMDLGRLSLSIPGAEYEPEQFPGVVLHLDEPKATVLIFRNGRLICLGVTSRSDADQAIASVAREIEHL